MGNWDNAFIKSIMFVGCVAIVYFLVMVFVDGYELHEFIILLAIYSTGYLLISFMAWIIIGLPMHYFISKYTDSSYLYYSIAVMLLAFILWCISNAGTALFFGSFAFVQALTFRYLVFKKSSKQINERT